MTLAYINMVTVCTSEDGQVIERMLEYSAVGIQSCAVYCL